MDRYDVLDTIKFLLMAILLVAVVVLSIYAISFGSTALWNVTVNRPICQQFSEMMPDQDFQWEFWTGCTLGLSDGTRTSASDWMHMKRLDLDVKGEK